jgi:plastocyanin
MLQRMRLVRPLLLAAAALAAVPATASAANAEVSVGDNFFNPKTVQIQPGDSVTWRWTGSAPHNVKADSGQTESFGSKVLTGTGNTFEHTFADPGRFTYFCEIHGPVMSGAVEVGPPPFPDTLLPRLTRLKASPGGAAVMLSFRLSEGARVKVSLRGPSRRSLTKRLGKGRRSVRIRRLRAGRYSATVRPTDVAGNRGRAVTKRFTIG